MQITISSNFPKVQASLDRLQAGVREKALASALNKTIAQGQTAMSREIRQEFNISAAKVREKLQIRRASFKQGAFAMEAVLMSKDPSGRRRAINLINFGARVTKAGLTAKIKRTGGRVLIKGAFIGNKGRTAFKRAGKERLPIRPLQTIDVPQMFNTKRINAKVVRLLKDKFPEVFAREARFYVDRFNRGSK